MKRMKHISLFLLAAAAVVAVTAIGCGSKEVQTQLPESTPVEEQNLTTEQQDAVSAAEMARQQALEEMRKRSSRSGEQQQ